MPNGAPTTMIISKNDNDDSNDSFASDEASDLSVALGMCATSVTLLLLLLLLLEGVGFGTGAQSVRFLWVIWIPVNIYL